MRGQRVARRVEKHELGKRPGSLEIKQAPQLVHDLLRSLVVTGYIHTHGDHPGQVLDDYRIAEGLPVELPAGGAPIGKEVDHNRLTRFSGTVQVALPVDGLWTGYRLRFHWTAARFNCQIHHFIPTCFERLVEQSAEGAGGDDGQPDGNQGQAQGGDGHILEFLRLRVNITRVLGKQCSQGHAETGGNESGQYEPDAAGQGEPCIVKSHSH